MLTAILASLVLLAWPGPILALTPERSVSSSRQFIVYSDDVRLRGAICELAEETKRDLLRLLAQRDGWATPIIVHAQFPQANLPEVPRSFLNFSQTGFGLKLQLDLAVSPDLQRAEIQRELLRATILEMVYRQRSNVPAFSTYVSPPDWLLDGILSQHSGHGASLAPVLAAPVATQMIVSLEEFLRQRPELLDAPGRSLYEAYSFVLVDLLLRAPDGRRSLGRFIASLPAASNDPMADLRRYFPGLSDEAGVWAAHVTALFHHQPDQLLSAIETERALDEILRLKIAEAGVEKHFALEDFTQWIEKPPAKPALAAVTRDLIALGARANPIYRRILADYLEIASQLARGKTKGIAARLTRTSLVRQDVAARSDAIDDYLNWFEATKSRGLSGAFAKYMKAAEAAAQPMQTRRDPISVYLDVLETQF